MTRLFVAFIAPTMPLLFIAAHDEKAMKDAGGRWRVMEGRRKDEGGQ